MFSDLSNYEIELFKFYCYLRNTIHNVVFQLKSNKSITVNDDSSLINKEKINIFENKRILSFIIINLSFGVVLEAIYLTYNSINTEPIELLKSNKSGSNNNEKIKRLKSKIKHNNLEKIIKENINNVYILIQSNVDLLNALKSIILEIKENFEISNYDSNLYKLDKTKINYFSIKIFENINLSRLLIEVRVYLDQVLNTIEEIYE